jgi:hypothetical protein
MRLYFIGPGHLYCSVEIKVLLMAGYPIAAPEWHHFLWIEFRARSLNELL